MRFRVGWVCAAALLVWAAPAVRAQDGAGPRGDGGAPEQPDPAGAEPPARPAQPTDEPAGDRDRELSRMRTEMRELRAEMRELRQQHQETQEQVKSLLPLSGKLTGYLDFGFFHVSGNGSGIREDFGYQSFPEYDGSVPDFWTFMGDPLSTAINSRGDPAETSGSRAVVFDPIGADGPTFLVNALNLSLFAAMGEALTLNASVDLVPRGRDVSNPNGLFLGDFLDVKLAYLEYLVPIERFGLSLYAGKFDSVLGYEYRTQEAPDRLTVTPSLVCRYVCGRPLGVKARVVLLDDHLIVNTAITNGSHFKETFNFADEVDSNSVPTVATRVSAVLPVGAGLEIGASAAVGAQDAQPADDRLQWHVGGDLHLEVGDLEVTGEYVYGRAQGDPAATDNFAGADRCAEAPCLRYQAAYGLVGYRLTNWAVPYARVDWRDALHRSGMSFLYISELWRATVGARVELGSRVVVKGEYTANRELGRIPQFANDVFTTSLIVTY